MFPLSMRSALQWNFARWIRAAGLMLAASCSPGPEPSVFDDTGELVALSGGHAGAQAACHACHGLDGAGDGQLVPRIAALESGYLARQLIYFADGLRSDPAMGWIASRMTSRQRLAVAEYYAEMEWEPSASQTAAGAACDEAAARLYQFGDPGRGLAACATCHDEDGSGVGQGNPDLRGQPAAYIAAQLHAWRKGERFGDPMGTMLREARLLEETEIRALADYIAGLGLSPNPGSPAECSSPRRPGPRSGA